MKPVSCGMAVNHGICVQVDYLPCASSLELNLHQRTNENTLDTITLKNIHGVQKEVTGFKGV
jgi:hypothetical protein